MAREQLNRFLNGNSLHSILGALIGVRAMLRLIGAVMIIAACGLVGIIVSKSYLLRPKYLHDLSAALQLLETEINYTRTSLPEACTIIAKRIKEPVSQFFTCFAESLKNESGVNAQEAWDNSLIVLADAGFLKQDIEIIKQLGSVLGRSDAADQLKHITALQKRIQALAKVAELERDKNVRLWNYLGFCIGALVVLLLI